MFTALFLHFLIMLLSALSDPIPFSCMSLFSLPVPATWPALVPGIPANLFLICCNQCLLKSQLSAFTQNQVVIKPPLVILQCSCFFGPCMPSLLTVFNSFAWTLFGPLCLALMSALPCFICLSACPVTLTKNFDHKQYFPAFALFNLPAFLIMNLSQLWPCFRLLLLYLALFFWLCVFGSCFFASVFCCLLLCSVLSLPRSFQLIVIQVLTLICQLKVILACVSNVYLEYNKNF